MKSSQLRTLSDSALNEEKHRVLNLIANTKNMYAKRDLHKYLDRITQEMSIRARKRQN